MCQDSDGIKGSWPQLPHWADGNPGSCLQVAPGVGSACAILAVPTAGSCTAHNAVLSRSPGKGRGPF